jgi:hypothetical protein
VRGSQIQDRGCPGGACNSAGHCTTKPYTLAPKCNPSNYLDRATVHGIEEDNAAFVDRNDAAGRRLNGDGFIRGPVLSPSGELQVNDRIAVISYDDIMPRIMQRVAQEVAQCLRQYAAHPLNRGRYPWPAPLCHQGSADAAIAWADGAGALFGRVPGPPFRATSESSAGAMLANWTGACTIVDPGALSWWSAWKRHVFYALGPALRPQPGVASRCSNNADCLQVHDGDGRLLATGKEFAVLVSGAPIVAGALAQSHAASPADARHWLEGSNADLRRMNPNPESGACAPDPLLSTCAPVSSCNRVTLARGRESNDVALAWP